MRRIGTDNGRETTDGFVKTSGEGADVPVQAESSVRESGAASPKGARGETLEVVGEPMPETSHTLVRFSEVQKSYDGETLVVKDLNLDVKRGEFLTMLGPSGSGKTTCLLMLAGFEPVTYG